MRARRWPCAGALALGGILGCAGAREEPLVPPPAERLEEAPRRTPSTATPEVAPAATGLTRTALREVLRRGPARVLAALEFAERPVFRDGRFVGLRVLARRDSGASRALFDVRPGDVVTAVNGIAPRTPDDLAKAARVVLEAPEVEVALLRDGQPVVLRVPVRAD
jgi:type II secretory pathway component PulC